MKKLLSMLSLGFILSLSTLLAQEGDITEPQPFEIPDPVAIVDGEAITKAELEDFIVDNLGADLSFIQNKDQVNQLIDSLVATRIIHQKALKKTEDDEAFAKEYEAIKKRLEAQLPFELIAAYIDDYAQQIEVSEEEIKAEYDKQLEALSGVEYKAAHILVEEEAEAEEILKELKEGTVTFDEAAKKHSIEPGAAERGGDLGWFSGNMMVREFSSAVETMTAGDISEKPVKTDFGFHIIFLEDTRQESDNFPSLEAMEEELKQLIIQDKLYDYVQSISKEVTIEYKLQ